MSVDTEQKELVMGFKQVLILHSADNAVNFPCTRRTSWGRVLHLTTNTPSRPFSLPVLIISLPLLQPSKAGHP